MAVTVKVSPQNLTPVYNEVVLVLDSTKRNQDKFQYKLEFNVNGATISSIRLASNPDGYGVAEIHKHLETQVTSDLDHDNTLMFQRATNSRCLYNVGISEEYLYNWNFDTVANDSGFTQLNSSTEVQYFTAGDEITVTSDYSTYSTVHTITTINGTGSITTDQTYAATSVGTASNADNSTTTIFQQNAFTDDLLAFNGVLGPYEYIDYDYTDYVMATGGAGKFLTNLPDGYKVTNGDRLFLNFYQDSTIAGKQVDKIRIISSNGTFDSDNIYNANSDQNKLIQVGVGPWNLLNSTATFSVVSGSLPILDNTVDSYTIQLMDSSSTALSELRTFNIDYPCTVHEVFRFLFKDGKGSWICLYFDKANEKTIRTKVTDYRQNYGSYNPTTNTWGYSSQDRGTKFLDADIEEKYKVYSNWVNENTGSMIIEMIKHPGDVYHLDENGALKAIKILTNRVKQKTVLNDKLFNYEIEFEYALKQMSARG